MRRPVVIDVSKYDYDLVPQHVDGVIQRTSYHMIMDPSYERIGQSIRHVPIREMYHYYGLGTPWYQQYELIMYLYHNNPYTTYQRAWIDAENDRWGNEYTPKFLNEVGELLRLVGNEVPCGVYANRDGYMHLENHLGADFMNKYPLWLADPHENFLLPSFFRGNPTWGNWRRGADGKWFIVKFERPESDWTYWQTSFLGDPKWYGLLPDQTGYTKKAVDVNVYNGTPNQLRRENGVPVWNYVHDRARMINNRMKQ